MFTTIISWFAGIWGKVAIYGAIAAAVIVGLTTVYFEVKKSGEEQEINAQLMEGIKNVEISNKITDAVITLPDADVDKQLRKSYQRD